MTSGSDRNLRWPFPSQASRESLRGVPFATRCPYCGRVSVNRVDYAYRFCSSCRELYDWAGQDLHAERERVPASAEWWVTLGGTSLAMEEQRIQRVEAIRRRAVEADASSTMAELSETPLLVTAGIMRQGGRILIARRPSEDALAGHWELPGGKVEAGERPEECLARELREECGIKAVVGRQFAESTHRYPHATIHLLAFWVDSWSGELVLHARDDHRWVSLSDVESLRSLRAEVQR